MTEHLPTPHVPPSGGSPIRIEDLPAWGPAGLPPEDEGVPWSRYVAALVRFRWMIAAIVVLGFVGAAVVYRVTPVQYTAEGSLWVKTATDGRSATGPIDAGGLLSQTAWIDLLRSGQVLDTVALRHGLFLSTPDNQTEEPFTTFGVAGEYRPGSYILDVSADGARWTLRTRRGEVLEGGATGSPVGAAVGIAWTPPAGSVAAGSSLEFSLASPGQAGRSLDDRLITGRDQDVNFIRVAVSSEDPVESAELVNAILERFVEVADRLKREDLDYRVRVVGEQLAQVEDSLSRADGALESFRVSTATLPSDQATPIVPGIPLARDNPVISNFHQMRQELDALQRDRNRLAKVLADVSSQGLRVSALDLIPTVRRSTQLTRALTDLVEAQASMRALEAGGLLPEHPEVVQAREAADRLELQVIPNLGRQLMAELDEEIRQQQGVIDGTARELSGIPVRSIEEGRLARQRESWSLLQADLQQRFQEARLSAASMTRDVELHDRAFPPEWPSNDQRLRLAFMLLLGSFGLAVGSALVLDRLDPKVRYPKQVTGEFGLEILGTVPRIGSGRGRRGRENRDQVLEAFRDLRLNLEYAYGSAGPLIVTISSPGQSEGKSLISTNLALAFAEMGKKTILVDGDTRRGDAHRLLGVNRKPGLTDVLQRTVEARDAIQVTEYPQLDYLGSGSRLPNSPELLGTVGAQRLFAWLRGRYQVVLVDSPPLGAGSDAFILSALTGNLALVLRNGASDRGLIQSRMESIHRLPIRLLGAIMNDVELSGVYKYYGSYIPGYAAGSEDDEEAGRPVLTDGNRAAD